MQHSTSDLESSRKNTGSRSVLDNPEPKSIARGQPAQPRRINTPAITSPHRGS